ncbi:hypothetical protein V1520DRAFT_336872 [Lipomyces starkeyi]
MSRDKFNMAHLLGISHSVSSYCFTIPVVVMRCNVLIRSGSKPVTIFSAFYLASILLTIVVLFTTGLE